MKFDEDLLEELIDTSVGYLTKGLTVYQKEYVDSGRWTEHWTMVFGEDGKFYRTDYELPSTEMQEGISPFEMISVKGKVECKEVFPHEVVRMEFRDERS